MTKATYDAWTEFEPGAAEAIRHAMRTGDWSRVAEYDPDVARNLEHAVKSDDFRLFDSRTTSALRAAISQDRMKAEMQNDRTLAAELHRLAVEFPGAAENQTEILEYAVAHELSQLDIAYKAWAHETGFLPGGNARSIEEPKDNIDAIAAQMQETRAELDKLGYHGTQAERSKLKYKLQDLEQSHGDAILAAANDPDARRRDLIHEANDASARRNAARTTGMSRGYVDKTGMSKDEKRARIDLEASDIMSGRAQAQKPQRKSTAQRAAEDGVDPRDIQAAEILRQAQAAPSNAEAVIQDIVQSTESGE